MFLVIIILHRCNECNYKWSVTHNNILHSRTACPACRPTMFSYVAEECISTISSATRLKFNTYLNGGEYKTVTVRVDLAKEHKH